MQVLVIGAGLIGLAVARSIALRGHEVVVAELADAIGAGVSSRSSEVIHAGVHYPAQFLRTRHCVAGRRMLYAYCSGHGVAHRKCGKLIVASNARECTSLEGLYARALANDVEGVRLIDRGEARALEPALACVGALLSPESGIVDSHALMLAFRGDLEAAGGAVALRAPVQRLRRRGAEWAVAVGGREPLTLAVDAVVNAAGLGSQAVARSTEGYSENRVPPLVLAKGSYFGCSGRSAFSRLIYPAPVDGGLGVHATLDLSGRVRFGPDVEWVDAEDYAVAPDLAASFCAAIRRYWPALPDGALFPDYAGIRPKLSGPGEPPADFVIDGPAEHGLPGLVHLFGIESPGLTAALSIAEDVTDRLTRG